MSILQRKLDDMNTDRLLVTYLLESPISVEAAAEVLAGEQSTGTFVAVPGETPELKERFRTRVEQIRVLETVDAPGFAQPPALRANRYTRAEVQVSIPLELVGSDLTTVLSSIFGNVSELRELSGLRLVDFDVPADYAATFPRPQFGVEGTRKLADVWGRPLVGSIIKPSVGLVPEQTAAMARELLDADIDFIKDDELMTNPHYAPLEKRVAAVMRVINDHAERTGKKAMFAFNVSSDSIDTMRRNHDLVLAAGGTCIMLSLNHVGYSGVMSLRQHSQLPIHGHRNGWGMWTRAPQLGMDYTAYQKLWRLAGVDQLHVNGIRNKFWEPDESVIRSISACLAIWHDDARLMPVVSSGQWGGQAPDTFAATGTVDLMYLAGGGIQGHPDGPTAGVRAIQQAWEAAVSGQSIEEYACNHIELRHAVETFERRV